MFIGKSSLTVERALIVTFAVLAFLLRAPVADAHEVWLAPSSYTPDAGADLAVDIKNGEKFLGSALYYSEQGTQRLERIHNGNATVITARLGDVPAIRTGPLAEGLHTIVYVSNPTDVFYPTFAKFEAFAEEKGFGEIARRHAARGLPGDKFREAYTRFAKSMIAVGHGAGLIAPLGLETEIVALDNPYTLVGDEMRVALTYQGKPRADALLTIFARGADNVVSVSTMKTDAAGLAVVPVVRGTTYLLDAVVLRRPSAKRAAKFKAVWESLWASLTFAVPAEPSG
ncbi:MAG: DUF4198 domain-containing protein [Pseudomonadota bacterium]